VFESFEDHRDSGDVMNSFDKASNSLSQQDKRDAKKNSYESESRYCCLSNFMALHQKTFEERISHQQQGAQRTIPFIEDQRTESQVLASWSRPRSSGCNGRCPTFR